MEDILVGGVRHHRFEIFKPYADEISHGVFPRTNTRTGMDFNISFDHGQTFSVIENRRIITETLCGDRRPPDSCSLASAKQIHQTHIEIVTSSISIQSAEDEYPDTDAFISDRSGVFLMMKTADCQPILLYDPVLKVVAAVHAGWRGIVRNIVSVVIDRMREKFGTSASDLRVGIGPSLGPCCSEFRRRNEDFQGFEHYFLSDYRVDLPAITRDQMLYKNILPKNMEFCTMCTCCRKDIFFSYRADDPDAGRFGSVIGKL